MTPLGRDFDSLRSNPRFQKLSEEKPIPRRVLRTPKMVFISALRESG